MTVTEIAILPLSHALTTESPNLSGPLIQKLKTAKSVLETASGHSFYYFQQIEDPSTIYILGSWDSVSAHETFLPLAENQNLLALLKDDIMMHSESEKKMTMWHLNTDVFAHDLSKGEKVVFTQKTISLNRHFVASDKRNVFSEKFTEVKGILEDFTKPYGVVGGWRVEKEGREEWDLFSGFESVGHHYEFPKTEQFEKYREIANFVEGFEVKHLRAIEDL